MRRYTTLWNDFSKCAPTAVAQRQIIRAPAEENLATVDKLVLCQEDRCPDI